MLTCHNLSNVIGSGIGAVIFLGISLISFAPSCDGGNILVFPVDGSHWVNMKVLLEELHAKGHNLTVLRSSTSWYIPEKSDLFTSITLQMKEDFEDFFQVFLDEQIKVYDLLCCIDLFRYPDKKLLMTCVLFGFRYKEIMLQHFLSSKQPLGSFQ